MSGQGATSFEFLFLCVNSLAGLLLMNYYINGVKGGDSMSCVVKPEDQSLIDFKGGRMSRRPTAKLL